MSILNTNPAVEAPTRKRHWMTEADYIALARRMNVDRHELDDVLDRRQAYTKWLNERIDYAGGRENL